MEDLDKEIVEQQRRLINAFKEVVEDTNGEALKDSPQEA